MNRLLLIIIIFLFANRQMVKAQENTIKVRKDSVENFTADTSEINIYLNGKTGGIISINELKSATKLETTGTINGKPIILVKYYIIITSANNSSAKIRKSKMLLVENKGTEIKNLPQTFFADIKPNDIVTFNNFYIRN